MVRINVIDETCDEIESTEVNFTLFEVFKMIEKIAFLCCGPDRLRMEVKEITSVDFKDNEISVMVIKSE